MRSPRRFVVPSLSMGLLLALHAFSTQVLIKSRREITVVARPVPLSETGATTSRTGLLSYRGGLWLSSEDDDFGGLSGLLVQPADGALEITAITDQGSRVTFHATLREGRLDSVRSVFIEPLKALNSQAIAGKALGDAESLTRLPDGRVLVGFERRHRIWAYDAGASSVPLVFETPKALEEAPRNGGIESLASFPDGRVLAIVERLTTKDNHFAAFLHQNNAWSELTWKATGVGFEPSDATTTPEGDLLVLERYFSVLTPAGIASRIARVKGSSVRAGAELEGDVIAELKAPLVTENFEGIAAFKTPSGATQVAIVSDDNFNGIQRTLLLLFEIEPPSLSPSK